MAESTGTGNGSDIQDAAENRPGETVLNIVSRLTGGEEPKVLLRDEATGLDLWAPTEQPAAAPASAPATGPSWAMAADASARAEPATTGPAPKPAKGDWLDHAKFGLCKIEGLSGDGVCIIKLPNATRKKIRLDAMQVLTPREDEGRQIFPVRRKVK